MKNKKVKSQNGLLAVEKTFQKIALSEGTTVDYVKSKIKEAILIGWNSKDPQTREMWRQIPCKGDMPTPEELVYWGTNQVLSTRKSMLS